MGRSRNSSPNFTQKTSAMELEKVVPDVIDAVPLGELTIHYASGVDVDQGNELTPTQVAAEPNQIHWVAEKGALYTLCMIDPDVPSRAKPTKREYLHWLVVNIPEHNIKKGEIHSSYEGSSPPEGSGLHRYVFLVYKQTNKLFCDENYMRKGRVEFSIKKFAQKYYLGEAEAGNFFQAQCDEHVHKTHHNIIG